MEKVENSRNGKMKVLNKIRRGISYVKKYDVLQSLYWCLKLNLPCSASFHVYPNSIVDIQEDAIVCIKQGELAINASWFGTRKRRYVSASPSIFTAT